MRLIKDIHEEKKKTDAPVISIEFFPPKTPAGDASLLEKTIPALMKLKPDYCSVTYGAGGSTREKTLMIVDRIQKEHGLTAMAHLTCVCATREDIQGVLEQARSLGIQNILALRGDPPGGTGEFVKTEGGFEYSYELVEFIRNTGGFGIGVAGFPEGHIACKEGPEIDWDRLKKKIDSGADFVLTQLFFDNEFFLRFRDHMENKLGVTVPLCPGILPVLNTRQIKKFTELCGATIPGPMMAKLEELEADDEVVREYGVEYATRQCEELLREGVPGIHLYCLNKAYSVSKIVKNLDLAPEEPQTQAEPAQ